jgi:hypothetical protein
MAITSEPGGTYSVIFNAQYAIDPSDRTAQTAADMRAVHYLEGGRIYGNYCRRHPYQNIYTRCLYGGRCTVAASVTITLDGSGVYILDLSRF